MLGNLSSQTQILEAQAMSASAKLHIRSPYVWLGSPRFSALWPTVSIIRGLVAGLRNKLPAIVAWAANQVTRRAEAITSSFTTNYNADVYCNYLLVTCASLSSVAHAVTAQACEYTDGVRMYICNGCIQLI